MRVSIRVRGSMGLNTKRAEGGHRESHSGYSQGEREQSDNSEQSDSEHSRGEHHEHSLRELHCFVEAAVPRILHPWVTHCFCTALMHVVCKCADPEVCRGLIHKSSLAMVFEARHQLNQ